MPKRSPRSEKVRISLTKPRSFPDLAISRLGKRDGLLWGFYSRLQFNFGTGPLKKEAVEDVGSRSAEAERRSGTATHRQKNICALYQFQKKPRKQTTTKL
ncbi:hypothetical protein Bbelb_162920 [Branchiostoma belcheri]|nr:hypothetical protein Bbelb_162920 [Branchiostoma belcheri]